MVILLNFQPDTYREFKIGVPQPGIYQEIFNSDEEKFGGSGQLNPEPIKSKKGSYHGQEQYIQITVPPVGGTIFSLYEKENERR